MSAGLTIGTLFCIPFGADVWPLVTVAERGLLLLLGLGTFSCIVWPGICTDCGGGGIAAAPTGACEPKRPRFMMLAGVTGVMCSCGCGVGAGVLSVVVDALPWRKFIGASGCGVAGGGIDKSTGDGVSPGISPGLGPLRLLLLPPLLRPDAAGKSGVELADFVPRKLGRRLLAIEGMF